jgi:protein O-GlcNAc transferase
MKFRKIGTSDDVQTHSDAAQACTERGDLSGAVAHYKQVLKAIPDHAPSHSNLGNAYLALGKRRLAEISYRRAINAAPDYSRAHFQLGIVLSNRGDLEGAAVSYLRCLRIDPDYADAHYALALIYSHRGDGELAKASYRRVLSIHPCHVAALQNLGNLLKEEGDFGEAESLYQRALRQAPGDADIYNNLGSLYYGLGDLRRAEAAYERALRLKADHVNALANLATIRHNGGRLAEALNLYHRSVQIDPYYARGWHQLGRVLIELGHFDKAVAAYRLVISLKGDSGSPLAGLVSARQMTCDWDGLEADQNRLISAVRSGSSDVAPIILLTQPCGPADHLACARQTSHAVAKGVRPLPLLHPIPNRPTGSRLRIGYLSCDFHEHATAHLAAQLFESHDRSQFEVTGYSYGRDDGSPMRARLKAAFDRFVDLAPVSHEVAAERIRGDAIDILIDLKGHCNDGRPQILAYRPAPIQVNFLGYPGSMGAAFIDYIIADPFVVPSDQQKFYHECLVHLPNCYQPNDNKREISTHPKTRRDWSLPEDAFVFCCFNSPHKIARQFFDIWMRLLAAVPKSVLWLIEGNDLASANLCREAKARNIDPSRLIFAPKVPLGDHLVRHGLADLFLDTLPYNAHTTASDALWAGLPVLTCVGHTFAGRVAGSLLTALGLPELITSSPDGYEERALKLARDAPLLAAIRKKLLRNRETAVLFDTGLYTRHIEAAYRKMYEIWETAGSPEPFSVPPQ